MSFGSVIIDDTDLNQGCAEGGDDFGRSVPLNGYGESSSAAVTPLAVSDPADQAVLGLGVGPLGWWYLSGGSGSPLPGIGVKSGYAYCTQAAAGSSVARYAGLHPSGDWWPPFESVVTFRLPPPGVSNGQSGIETAWETADLDGYPWFTGYYPWAYWAMAVDLSGTAFGASQGLYVSVTQLLDDGTTVFDETLGVVVNSSITAVQNVLYKARFRNEDDTLRARVWRADIAEPSGWDVSMAVPEGQRWSTIFGGWPNKIPRAFVRIKSSRGGEAQLHGVEYYCDAG